MVEQALDRVAFRFITTDWRDCDDEGFRPTKSESGEVAIALRGAIVWFRVTEFTSLCVWTAVVVDIDEVEADNPRVGAEDHRRLLNQEAVDDGFHLVQRNSVKLSESVVIGVRSTSGIGDGLDRFLIDSGLQECLTDNPGVEVAAFDSGDRDLRQEIKR